MKNIIIIIILLICFLNTNSFANDTKLSTGINTIYLQDRISHNSNFKLIAVDIYIPKNKIAGDILVLPGWKFSRTRWHRETDMTKYADKYGFRLVFPEMWVSSYESAYFHETTSKWGFTPGGEWIKSILLPELEKKYGIFKKDWKNFILGLSTGGRGVLLVALQNPDIFSGGATLSGDCDQSLMPGEKTMSVLYGEYGKFKARWENTDNPLKEIREGKWKIPLYIGHGKKDKVSPFEQSKLLYETLKKMYPNLKIFFNEPEWAEHDFIYWKSEVPNMMTFFNEIIHTK